MYIRAESSTVYRHKISWCVWCVVCGVCSVWCLVLWGYLTENKNVTVEVKLERSNVEHETWKRLLHFIFGLLHRPLPFSSRAPYSLNAALLTTASTQSESESEDFSHYQEVLTSHSYIFRDRKLMLWRNQPSSNITGILLFWEAFARDIPNHVHP